MHLLVLYSDSQIIYKTAKPGAVGGMSEHDYVADSDVGPEVGFDIDTPPVTAEEGPVSLPSMRFPMTPSSSSVITTLSSSTSVTWSSQMNTLDVDRLYPWNVHVQEVGYGYP